MMGVLGPGTRVTFLVRHGRGGILPGPRNIFKPEHNKQGDKAMNAVVVVVVVVVVVIHVVIHVVRVVVVVVVLVFVVVE